MPHHSLLNNSEDGGVEIFFGVQYGCQACPTTETVRNGEEPDFHHGSHTLHEHKHEVRWRGWAYAFGSQGYAWNTDPVGPFETEAGALNAARDALQDELNEAALARGFDADGREVA